MTIERHVQQRSMLGGMPCVAIAVGRRREDLRHRAGLLVGRVAGGGLGEHRLRVGVGVALLLVGTEASEVALADGLDRGRQREDLEVALAVLPPAAAGVEQAPAARPIAAEARVLARRERRRAVVVGGDARGRLVAHVELGLRRHLADPVLLEGLLVARVDQRVGVLLGVACPTRCPRTGAGACAPGSWPRRRCARRAWSAPCRPGRRASGCSRRRCRASRAPCPAARRCPSPRASRRDRRRGADRRPGGCAWRSRTSRRGSGCRPSSAR